jgi:hypothetical protein
MFRVDQAHGLSANLVRKWRTGGGAEPVSEVVPIGAFG